MAIVASNTLSITVSRYEDTRTKGISRSVTVQASGLIEGENIPVPLNPDISKVEGVAEAMQTLLDAADAALAGKTVAISAAVAAPKMVAAVLAPELVK